jgi:hypothetical protein
LILTFPTGPDAQADRCFSYDFSILFQTLSNDFATSIAPAQG